jgi:hypothetical protein
MMKDGDEEQISLSSLIVLSTYSMCKSTKKWLGTALKFCSVHDINIATFLFKININL